MNCNMGMEAEIYPFLPTLLLVLVCHCRGKSEECFATLEQNAVVRAIDKKKIYVYVPPLCTLGVQDQVTGRMGCGSRWCLLDAS